MDSTLAALVASSIRWLHLVSVVILLGAYFYTYTTKTVMAPAFRSTLWGVMVTILASGLYQFLSKSTYPKGYHMWFGIKFLLVLHIFAVTVLNVTSTPDAAKFQRRAFMVVISGFLAIAVANYLRWLSTSAVL
jgi:hypothetical protein